MEKKYKDTSEFLTIKKINRFGIFINATWYIWVITILLIVSGLFILSILFPIHPQPFIFTWEGILMFMGISAGIGWMIHGTGFLLVKVN